jgi:hypothetical protein
MTLWVRLGSMPAEPELVFCAQHGHAIAGTTLMVPARTLGHLTAVVGMMATGPGCRSARERSDARRSDSSTSTWTTANCTPPSSMSCALRPRQASTNDGTGQRGHIEHAAPPRHPLQGPGDRRVGQLGHDTDIGTNLPDPQSGFEGVDLLHLGTDHGQGVGQTGLKQGVAHVRAPLQVRDTPVLQEAGEPAVGESSITMTGVPLRWSCSTMRSPTPWSPHTIT